jgi:hypothetical protein
MPIQPGDVFEAVLKRAGADGESNHRERIAGYRLIILSVSGEKVGYQREGSAPSETTLSILQDAIHRGDLVRVIGESAR